ncbi:MAG: hypothetical protein JWN86_1352 [Planctomycetota bacterium]|nr:hypothetical protein [Planctomycetota bacterium]
MRFSLRSMALAGVLVTGLLVLGTTPAQAQGYGGGYYGGGGGYGQGYGGGGYGGGYGSGGYYGGGGYGQGYGVPTQQYYGNGGHDFQPHWHTTQTPVGSFAWYGNGVHDSQPHEHTNSANGGYRGYSPSPFGGVTTSYYNSTPYTYMPW